MRPVPGARFLGAAALALSLALPVPRVAAQDSPAAPASSAGATSVEPADLVVVNATVHTMDPDRPRAEALAVRDGRIVALGTTRAILEAYDPDETIDAAGRTVIPGLIDAHAHIENLGEFLRTIDLVDTESPKEVADLVRDAAGSTEPGEWILGRGWDQNDWEVKEFPERGILDEVAPDHPVYLKRVDGHAIWVNSRALEAAGIDADTPDPAGGRILRGPGGEPTGVLIDDAEDLVEPLIEPDAEEVARRLDAAQHHLVSLGVTGVHDMGTKAGEVRVYAERAAAGEVLPRLVLYLDSDDPALFDWWESDGRSEVPGGDGARVRVAGFKLYADGALGSRGAALLEPYSDDPGNRGLLVTRPDTLAARTARTLTVGLQPAIHAIGDRGNRVALDAIEHAWREEVADGTAAYGADPEPGYAGWPNRPPRIEHAQVVAPEDIGRFVELGVIASFQPTHATSDMYWAEDRVGSERIEGAYAWRTFREAGARLACGSDFPVERANPFHGLYAAVTRQDQEGWPEGGWRPAERMTREEALACFTRDAAAAAGMDDEVGSLEVGKRADFLILDVDPMAVPTERIWTIAPLRTVIDGETVHRAEAGPDR